MNKMHIYKWVILLQNMKNSETEGTPAILLISEKQDLWQKIVYWIK